VYGGINLGFLGQIAGLGVGLGDQGRIFYGHGNPAAPNGSG
jgi:hypothetical protein